MSFVIMLAGAKEISNGGVALTYAFATWPCLVVKLTGPYWFHYLPYRMRMYLCAVLMLMTFVTVGVAASKDSLTWKLLGVMFSGIQIGMGECSFLALASYYDTKRCLTAWAAGTGIAGIIGYGWTITMIQGLGMSFTQAMYLATILVVFWIATYLGVLDRTHLVRAQTLKSTSPVAFAAKFRFVMSLWPYMIPLIVVYFSEFAMQSGAWAAIGFPVTERHARDVFYSYSNWMYQFGVFISRSSGAILQANRLVLWIMPMLQTLLLVFFMTTALYQYWYNWGLLSLAFVSGLLGGGVYVNAFTLIAREVHPDDVELALCSASVGDTIGIMIANVVGLFLQCLIYKHHHLEGAVVSC